MEQIKATLAQYEERLLKYPVMKQVKDQVKVDVVYVVIAALILILGLIYAIVGMDFVCALATFLPPVYKSFKAVEKKEEKEDAQWLTYWILWSSISVIDSCGNVLYYIVPHYTLIKTVFLLWAWSMNGAATVYHAALKPIFDIVQAHMDELQAKKD